MVIISSTIQSLDGIFHWSLGLGAGGNMQFLLLCWYKRQVRSLLTAVTEKSPDKIKIPLQKIYNQLPWTHTAKTPEEGNMNEIIWGILIQE
jgi:hypothetical protein